MIYLSRHGEYIAIACCSIESEEWESNHIIVKELNATAFYPALRNILTNILSGAEVKFIEE